MAPPSRHHQQPNNTITTRRRTVPSRIIHRETITPSLLSDTDLDLPFWQQTWFLGILLLMALSFFGLAVFLFLTLDSDYTSTPVYAVTSEGVEVIRLLFDLIMSLIWTVMLFD